MGLAKPSLRTFLGGQEGKLYSGHENDFWGMNFRAIITAMELYALLRLLHDLEQQRMANQTRGPVRDGDKRPFYCIQIRKWAARERGAGSET